MLNDEFLGKLKMESKLSIVVPAYNEALNLAHTVCAAERVLSPLVPEGIEWVLVDDGSADGTWAEMLRLAGEFENVVPVQHARNMGLGAAVHTGLMHTSGEWCTWTPADGQFSPQAFVDMFKKSSWSAPVLMMRNERRRSWLRQLLSLVLNGLIRFGLGVDVYGYSGIFLVRRALIQDLPLYSQTSVQNYMIVIHCQKKGARFSRVSTDVQPRLSGASKVANLRTILKIMYDIARLRRKMGRQL